MTKDFCPKSNILKESYSIRAWVSTGAAGAWHPPKFWTSPLAPADFEVLNNNWHPQSSFYVTSGTLSFKFLTQALRVIMKLSSKHQAVVRQSSDGYQALFRYLLSQIDLEMSVCKYGHLVRSLPTESLFILVSFCWKSLIRIKLFWFQIIYEHQVCNRGDTILHHGRLHTDLNQGYYTY